MKTIRQISRWLFMWLITGGTIFLSAHAFVPEPGLWIIDTENTGRPGRGFFIDTQGSTLVLSVYAYTSDRDAQWYQAAGLLSNNQVTAKLDVFEGGTAFGEAYKAAVHIGSVGDVALKFNSPVTGTIQFPGEAPKAFSRFNFARPVAPGSLDGTYVLERVTVKLASNGVVADSKLNVAVKGALVINGNNAKSKMTMTYNGATQSTPIGSYNIVERDAASFTAREPNGIQTKVFLIKQGDELITLVMGGQGMETDYWRRTSAIPNDLALRDATGDAPDDEEPTHEKHHDSAPLGLAIHEMLDRN